MSNLDNDYFLRGLQAMEALDSGKDDDWAKDDVVKDHRNYISSGDLNMFDMCPAKVYYAKVAKAGFSLDIGFHYNNTIKSVLSAVMEEKLNTKKLVNPEHIWEMPYRNDPNRTVKEYWENYKDSGFWEEEPTPEDLEEYSTKLNMVSSLFISEFASEVVPKFVEKRLYLPVPGGSQYSLFMNDYVDLMDESGVVYLYKYPSRTPSMNKDTSEYQVSGSQIQTLVSYASLLTNFKVPEHGCPTEAVYLIGTKKPKLVRQQVVVTQKQVDALVNKAVTQWQIIAKDLFTTNRGCDFCKDGKGGCSYYQTCHEEF